MSMTRFGLLVVTLVVFITGSALGQQSDDKEWWESTVFYQIYPRSFFDSKLDDGVGDINGVTAKLQHLKDLGIEATWLSPIFSSPQVDFGYDVSNFIEVDPLFGTNEELENLFAEAKKLGIRIVLDFVPNHSSNEHEWFKKSERREDPYTDYYIWHDGKTNAQGQRIPPNNWQSVFYGSAWQWSDIRGQYYLHQFAAGQPDLNYRNEAMVREFDEILRFWMRKGASGFRIDAINHMFEIEDLRDEPINDERDPNSYGYTHHIYTKDLPETYEVIGRWRKVIDDYVKENQVEQIIMMTEAYTNLTMLMRFYESEDGKQPRAHIPFNFAMIEELNSDSTAYDFKYTIDKWLENLPRGKITNWVLGNHDKPRLASRYGRNRISGMALLELGLPGVAVIYNGEEIGMEDFRDMPYEDSLDPQGCNLGPENYKWASRDPQRTPFQWDDTFNGGFSAAPKTWIPLHPLFRQVNLHKQKEADYSTYQLYVDVLAMRKERLFTHGDFRSIAFNSDVFAFVRFLRENEDRSNDPYHVIVINFSGHPSTVDLSELYRFVGEEATVRIVGTDSRHKVGSKVNTTNLAVGPYDALVVGNVSAASALHLSVSLFIAILIKHLLG
ncbi:maltase 1-like [Uranotaenia lowii]|uniref:maltase 1-like n=1 Tax=Uranotaenia lowii TaxID=190385 RepID=UPI002478F7F6|nr:maltase 1-like [Uranotaenia lowii]